MAQLPDSKHFALHPIAEGIFAAIAIEGGAAIGNAGLVDLGGILVVFDTFMTPQAASDLRRASEGLFGRAPDIVINSHYHNDHIWGNQVFEPGALIISSTRTRELITTAGMEELHWYTGNSATKLASIQEEYRDAKDEAARSQLSMWIGYYGGLVEAIPHLSVILPQITFVNTLEMHGSRLKAELLTFEEAHTGSDAVLYLPQAGVVFMSDLLFVGCHPYLADGDPLQLLNALRDLSELQATTFVPGHGPVGSRDDLRLEIEYIETCLETAQQLITVGDTSQERIADVEIAKNFRGWEYSQFFQANLRFLCERLKSDSRINQNEN